jgi:organic radical activating enzyme
LLVFIGRILYYFAMNAAIVDEVFASVQGEGPSVGQRHLFVRFVGCDLRCRYCDTPAAAMAPSAGMEHPCQAQLSPDRFEREPVRNPLDQETLTGLCERLVVPGPSKPVVSLTGGEPLLQAAFLAVWLPRIRKTFRIHLETSGVHHTAMSDLRGLVDVVSMDLKLPSSTGQGPRWNEHRRFLRAAEGIETVLKVIVTNDMSDTDLLEAVRLAAEERRDAPFILQPCSGDRAPSGAALVALQRRALAILPDVRVIPQAHRVLGLP